MRCIAVYHCFVLAVVFISMGLAVSPSLVSGKGVARSLKSGHLDDPVLENRKTLIARDPPYKSDIIRLDNTWEDVTLFTIEGASPGNGSTTIGASVEIACRLCYIKGTAHAELKVPGDGDVRNLFVDYKKSIADTINNITTEAFGPLNESLTKSAQKFLEATNVFEDRIESIAKDALDKVMEILDINTDKFKSTAEGVVDEIKEALNGTITGLKETTINFQDRVEDITKDAVKSIKDLLDRFGISRLMDDLEEKLDELGDELLKMFKEGFEEVSSALMKAFPLDSLDFPTLPIDFNLPDIDPIPDLSLSFALDDLELYLELEVTLTADATYTLPLFRSQSGLVISLPKAYAGAVVAIDLILIAEVEVQLQTGFHLKMDDSILVEIGMFAQNTSRNDFPGAQFEFLPVTVTGISGRVTGVLRVELKAGLELQNHTVDVFDKRLDIGAGVEVSVFANVAQFVAEIAQVSEGDDMECHLGLAFEFNVGAAAGATMVLGSHAWGPVPETTLSIYGTTTEGRCSRASTSTLSASTSVVEITTDDLQGRAALFQRDPETTTLYSTFIYTGRSCNSTGLINCPASLQNTTTSKSTITHVATITSGETPTIPKSELPSSSVNKVPRTVAFGSNMQSATSVSTTNGRPASCSFFDCETGGVSNKIIVGVSIGLGVPVLILVIAGSWLLHKHTQRKKTEMMTSQQ